MSHQARPPSRSTCSRPTTAAPGYGWCTADWTARWPTRTTAAGRHYLDRLRTQATGHDPGPDPFTTTRVPTPAELGDAAVMDGSRFEELVAPLLAEGGVTRSTMMGLPCLRREGAFFAALDRRTGALLVKLSRARVDELLETGAADPFAPAGRRFRQWAAVPPQRAASWPTLLQEALHAAGGPSGRGSTAPAH